MKAYTDIEQSKKLAEILPIESADMYFHGHQSILNPKEWEYEDEPKVRHEYISFDDKRIFHPCWSLAVLLELMPSQIVENAIIYGLSFWKGHDINGNTYCFEYLNNGFLYETETYYNPIDAAFEMICWLKENNKI